MSTRRALGRGISALIPDQGKVAVRVTEIPLKEIIANRYQPRKKFNDESIKGLAASIKENGIIQPILVHKVEKGYELIAGERRLRAAAFLKMQTIPSIIKTIQRFEALELALVENIQREDLNPIEEANAYRLLREEFKLTHDVIAKRVGKNRSSITNSLRLLGLPDVIKRDLIEGRLTMGHARALLSCETEIAMMDMRKQILDYGLNVRDVEKKAKSKKKKTGKVKPSSDTFIRGVEEKLKRKLSTKVSIKPNKKGGGVINIEYYTPEDLDRILESIDIS